MLTSKQFDLCFLGATLINQIQLIFLGLVACSRLFALDGLQIVASTKRIYFEKYPTAYNPSILKIESGYILSFRYNPHIYEPLVSHIGIVLLDDNFDPHCEPYLLDTRCLDTRTPSQSEDARLFEYRGRIFLIYNDNTDFKVRYYWERRDMFIAELIYENGSFELSPPLKLIYEDKYFTQYVQKNWVPFEWNQQLLLAYSLAPHEILTPNFANGCCLPSYTTSSKFDWNFGILRLSTPPLLVDGEYLAFFHSAAPAISKASYDQELLHYFMGAYTFSAEPPFQITQTTPLPIIADDFYTPSSLIKRVVFPGGFVVSGDQIHVVYGKDDSEIWIATIKKSDLKNAFVRVNK